MMAMSRVKRGVVHFRLGPSPKSRASVRLIFAIRNSEEPAPRHRRTAPQAWGRLRESCRDRAQWTTANGPRLRDSKPSRLLWRKLEARGSPGHWRHVWLRRAIGLLRADSRPTRRSRAVANESPDESRKDKAPWKQRAARSFCASRRR